MERFHGAITALITPFINGELDEKGLVELIESGPTGSLLLEAAEYRKATWLSSSICGRLLPELPLRMTCALTVLNKGKMLKG